MEEFVEGLEALQHQAIDYLEHARQIQSREVNKGRLRPKVMNVGQSVMLSTQYIQPAFTRTTGSRKLRAKYIGPFVIAKRVSPTSYELDLPANFKVHPVTNIEYLKEFHPSPERFVNRSDNGKNHMLNADDVIDSDELEQIRDHRESCQAHLQYLCHYKGTADHDDVWEHASRLSDYLIARDVMNSYWDDVYKHQQDQVIVTKKKQRRPRTGKVVKAATKQNVDATAPDDDAAVARIVQDALPGNDERLHVKSTKEALAIARA